MRTIYPESSPSKDVLLLKNILHIHGNLVTIDNVYDSATINLIKEFQTQNGLVVDGVVGSNTWEKLIDSKIRFNVKDSISYLPKSEYLVEWSLKDTIFLHHTVGGYQADKTISYWLNDGQSKPWRVGTAYVISGQSRKGDKSYDGEIHSAFRPYHFAHHLGLKKIHNNTSSEDNYQLNKKSIGVELCSFGPLKKVNGKYFSVEYPEKDFLEDQVCDLGYKWRGYQYFHKYSQKQLDSLEELILNISIIFNIKIDDNVYDKNWFDLKYNSLKGIPGIWTHSNVRYDKTDCYPDLDLINMLNGLHFKSKTFKPTYSLEKDLSPKSFVPLDGTENYCKDLNDSL